MSQNFSNQGFVARLAMFHALWVTGHEADTPAGSREIGQPSLHPTHRAQRARTPWSQTSAQAEGLHPAKLHLQIQEQEGVQGSRGLLLPFPTFGIPTAPTPLEATGFTTRLVMIHEQFFPIALLHCRNCGRDSRVTE